MNSQKVIFTDGSINRNGKTDAIGGIGVYIPGCNDIKCSENYTYLCIDKNIPPTNQKCELLAIYQALLLIDNIQDIGSVLIYSDSMYSINCITKWCHKWEKNGWKNSLNKAVKNQDIIKLILYKIRETNYTISFKHVRSHMKEPTNKESEEYFIWYGNDMADKLAKQGLDK